MIPTGGYRPSAGDAAELEALQADVMRFVAIIGLCLAAIFSLLQGVEPASPVMEAEGPPASPAPREEAPGPEPGTEAIKPLLAPAAPTIARPAPTPAPPPEQSRPVQTPPPPQQGFTLGFASTEVLYQLLNSGQVTLFAAQDDQYWRYQPGRNAFVSSPAPGSWYQMEASTVPRGLRDWLQGAGAQADSWGVALPAATVSALEQILASRQGGDLRIQEDGQVHVQASTQATKGE